METPDQPFLQPLLGLTLKSGRDQWVSQPAVGYPFVFLHVERAVITQLGMAFQQNSLVITTSKFQLGQLSWCLSRS